MDGSVTPVELRWPAQPSGEGPGQLALFSGPERVVGRGAYRGLQFVHVEARRLISRLRSPTPRAFRFTVNAYQGCSHACTYCFARLVRVLSEAGNPFSTLTKSTLVLRDLELLAEASRRTTLQCAMSVGTLDDDVGRFTEPGTPRPVRRLEAVARLNKAGVACNVLVAPVLPASRTPPPSSRRSSAPRSTRAPRRSRRRCCTSVPASASTTWGPSPQPGRTSSPATSGSTPRARTRPARSAPG